MEIRNWRGLSCALTACILLTIASAGRAAALRLSRQVLSGQGMTLSFPSTGSVGGRVMIRLGAGAKTEQMGVLDADPLIVYRDSRGNDVQARATGCKLSRTKSGIAWTTTYRGGTGTWTATTTYSLERPGTVLVKQTLTSSAPAKLVRFQGITLRAGEGAFGSEKDEALFPGLEYLLRGESSSSTLDITTSDHVRFAPHPNKVTVPLMCVVHRGRMIGLMWNPLQKWNPCFGIPGQRKPGSLVENRNPETPGAPRPLFSSPNLLEKRSGHLMGLFLPSIEHGRESELDAREPYEMKPGKPIALTARIICRRAAHCVDAVEDWIGCYGLPSPIPPPRPLAETLTLCAEPYVSNIWSQDDSGFGWFHQDLRLRSADPDICALLQKAADLLPDGDLAARVRERADFVAGAFAGGGHSLRSAYYHHHVRQAFAASRDWARRVIQGQKPDGSWRFYCGKDEMIAGFPRWKLGVQGEAASGIVASSALPLLRHARITGDQEALLAGLDALEFLNGLVRPQAAQVWEVPVHAPDILAAAKCCQAYLEAYRITGDEALLDRAVCWARTGLPFVYMWGAPERPIMKFGSIAIFGSSIFVVPWFGKPVQWNGLAYGEALFDLARYDKSFDWSAVARGLTMNGAQQQITEGEYKGYHPDYVHAITGSVGGPYIPPAQNLLPNTLRLLGVSPDTETVVLRTERGRVHISAPCAVDAKLDEGAQKLVVALRRTLRTKPVAFSVVGLGMPSRVSWNGAGLQEGLNEASGRWRCAEGLTVVTAPEPGDGTAILEYDSLGFTLPARVAKPAVEVTMRAPKAMATQETDAEILLRNTTNGSIRDVKLRVSAPEGWVIGGTALPGKTWEIEVDMEGIEAGATETLPVEWTPPPSQSGTYQWVQAHADYAVGDGRENARGALGVFVEPPVEASLQVTGARSGSQGTAVDCLVRVRSRTDMPYGGTVRVSVPGNWQASVQSGGEFAVAPSPASTVLRATLTAPPGAELRTHEIGLSIGAYGGDLPAVPCEVELPICCPRVSGIEVDGDLREWASAVWLPIGEKVTHKQESLPAPTGPDDLTARMAASWDNQRLYLGLDVVDDHQASASPGEGIWNSDSVQIGIDGLCERSTDGWDANDHEYGFALTTGGPFAWCWIAPEGEKPGERKSIPVAIRRDGSRTCYEIGIPWAEVGRPKPRPGDRVGVSFLVNDVDADGARKSLQLGGGLGLRKEPSKFVMLMLGR